MAFEVDARDALLDEGAPLVRTLRGRAAFAVAGVRRRRPRGAARDRASRLRRARPSRRVPAPAASRAWRERSCGPGRRHDSGRSNGAPVLDAYRICEAHHAAAAANFYYGIRLLPPDKRRAMCAVYAFARRVDDIGDGHAARRPQARSCSTRRATPTLATLARRASLMLVALADARRRFALPLDALTS